ncbi:unnamed protein product, partial [marine sediment metagenome]
MFGSPLVVRWPANELTESGYSFYDQRGGGAIDR